MLNDKDLNKLKLIKIKKEIVNMNNNKRSKFHYPLTTFLLSEIIRSKINYSNYSINFTEVGKI